MFHRLVGYFRARRLEAQELAPELQKEVIGKRVDPGLAAMEVTLVDQEGDEDMKWRKTKSQAELGLDKLNRLRGEGKIARVDPAPQPRSIPEARPVEAPAAPLLEDSQPADEVPSMHAVRRPVEGDARASRRYALRGGHVKPFRPQRQPDPIEDLQIPLNQHLASQIESLREVKVELKLPEVRSSEVLSGVLPHIPAHEIAVREARNAHLKIHSSLMQKTLRRHHIATLGDLMHYTEEELLALKGIGPATVDLLLKQLKKHGLKLPKPGEARGAEEEASLFSDGPMTRLDEAEQMAQDGLSEQGLAALLCVLADQLSGFVRLQQPTWSPSSPIRILRKLYRERQLSREDYEGMLEVVHLCSLASSGRHVSAKKVQQAFDTTRACLDALCAAPMLN